VAAPDLRIVRRSRGRQQASLVAASSPVDDPGKTFKSSLSFTGRTGWQTDAWAMLDQVGELRYYVGWRSNSCSRVRLVASELDEVGMPTGSTSNARVDEIVRAIGGSQLGAAQFIKRTVELLTIVGEAWVGVLVMSDGRERWLAFSTDEIKKKGEKVSVEMPDGTLHDLVKGRDTLFRIWNPHPRKAQEADSPVRASLPALQEIVRTTATIANASKSRLIGNGIVFVPQEMSLPMQNSPVSADKPGTVPVTLSGMPAVQELQELLYNVAKVAYEDDESFAAMIPVFAGVPGEMIQKVSHLKFDNQVTEISLKTRNDAIMRLAMGLEVSPERLLGLGKSSNHWSAWQIGDTDIQLHIAPAMETVCEALTDQMFRTVLLREGIDPDKYVIWYDTSKLTVDPDKTTAATNAFDRGAINAAAYRAFLGLGDDTGYDFTTIEGWRVWAQDQVSNDPKLLPELLPLLDAQVQGLDFPQALGPGTGNGDRVDAVPPQADTTNEGNSPNTETNQPGQDQGKRGRKQDVASRAIVEVMVARALELAGKRRRTRSDYERLRDIPMHQTHRAMGPVEDAAIPRLIEGWDASLEPDTLRLVGLDIDEVRAEVRRQVKQQLTAPMVDA
jgi:hypothetical protein